MAQGGKLKKAGGGGGGGRVKKSAASLKKQQKKQLVKGKRAFKAKGRKAEQIKQIADTSKTINKKNEVLISAKAISAGNTFFLNEIKDKGKKEIHRHNQSQMKKEKGSSKLTSRLKKQLRKMGKDI
jgi:hypothetical protein